MANEYKVQLGMLDNLIKEKDKLRRLTDNEEWEFLLQKLGEIRVDALSAAIADRDTTNEKAFARAITVILTFFRSLSSTVELEDLLSRRELLEKDIKYLEEETEANQKSFGAGGIV